MKKVAVAVFLVLSSALSLLTPVRAEAVIVYLDINNQYPERMAYEGELKRSRLPNASFEAIPEMNNQAAQQINFLAKRRDATWVQYVNSGCFAAETCSPEPVGQCGQIQSAVRSLEKQIEDVPKIRVSLESLEEGLSRINLAPGEKITLAMSGHFAGGEFTGNLGKVSVSEIDQIFAKFPRLRAAVTKLHLLGCYTNTFGQIEPMWRRVFPNARVLVGFYHQSPAGGDSINLKFIRLLVKLEDAFDRARSESDFRKIEKLLSRVGVKVALAIDDFYKTSSGRFLRISEQQVRGSACMKVLSVGERNEFLNVMAGEHPIPTNTSSSILRTYYTDLRNNLMCLEEPVFRKAQQNVPHPDKVIRLIFYRNLLTNFKRTHQADIANMNAMFQTLGVPASLSLQRVNLYDRAELQNWRQEVTAYLEAAKSDTFNDKAAERGLNVLKEFTRIVSDLDPYCIPLDWIEPSGFSRSLCFKVSGECK